jgi:hypothetical protein
MHDPFNSFFPWKLCVIVTGKGLSEVWTNTSSQLVFGNESRPGLDHGGAVEPLRHRAGEAGCYPTEDKDKASTKCNESLMTGSLAYIGTCTTVGAAAN